MGLNPRVWDGGLILGFLVLLGWVFYSSVTPEERLEPLGVPRLKPLVTQAEEPLIKTSPAQRARLFISVVSTKQEPVVTPLAEVPADLPAPPAPDRGSLAYLGGVTDQEKALYYFKDKRSGRLLPLNLDKTVDGWTLSSPSPTLWHITDPEGINYEVNR